MSEPMVHEERLTEYERAICYSTIPNVTNPLTYGAIAGYALLLIGASFLMVYGLRTEESIWDPWGMVVFGVVVVLGIMGFLARAIANQVQERSALAEAETLPNVESGFDALPDPFEGHSLLRHTRRFAGASLEVHDNRGRMVYSVAKSTSGQAWDVSDASDHVIMTITAGNDDRSFDLSAGTPSGVSVSRDDRDTAKVTRRPGFGSGVVDVRSKMPADEDLVFRAGGFYKGSELVGRIYFIRAYAYLDIRKTALNDGSLALFLTMIR